MTEFDFLLKVLIVPFQICSMWFTLLVGGAKQRLQRADDLDGASFQASLII